MRNFLILNINKVKAFLTIIIIGFILSVGTASAAVSGTNPPCDPNTQLCIQPPAGLPTDVTTLINNIIKFLTNDLLPPIIILVVLWSAFQFLTAGGDPKKINAAKQTLLYAIIGTVILLIGEGIVLIIKGFLFGTAGASGSASSATGATTSLPPGAAHALQLQKIQ